MSDTRDIDRVLQSSIGAAPGVVAMATTRAGTIYEGAFGRRDFSAQVPMTLDTAFWLASMTKAFTSAGALQLVEREKLSLDKSIADVLPELSDPKVLEGFSAEGVPRLRPAAGPITLRQLLSHSAGYGYSILNSDLSRYLAQTGVPIMPESFDDLRRTPLLFDPGAGWHYGLCTDIVGKAIERVSGQQLDEYLAEHVLGPLRMVDTVVSLSPEQGGRLARMHARAPDGSATPIDFAAGVGPSFMMGGGAYCGTASDFLRFARMILNNGVLDGVRVLSPASVGCMASNQLGDHFVAPMRSLDRSLSHDIDFYPGIDKTWSAAFMVNASKAPTGRSAGSLSWGGAANTFFWIDPVAGIAGVVLMQILPFCDPHALELFEAFERTVYAMIGERSGGDITAHQ